MAIHHKFYNNFFVNKILIIYDHTLIYHLQWLSLVMETFNMVMIYFYHLYRVFCVLPLWVHVTSYYLSGTANWQASVCMRDEASNDRTICGEQRQADAVCRSSHLDKVTEIKNRCWHLCVVFLTFLHILYVDLYCFLLNMIIFVSIFKMLFSLMIASCVTSCSPLFPPPFLLLTLRSLLFLPSLPLKFSPLLLFPHFLFSPSRL